MAELRFSAMAISGLSALVGGVAGALITITLVRGNASSADTRPRAEPLAQVSQPIQAPADERIASLERALRALTLKDSVTRAATAAAGASANGAERPPLADVAPIVDNPVFEAAVRDVMDRAEQERNLERETQRAEGRKRAAEEWGNTLGEKLRLTEPQKTKVTQIAQTFWDRLRDQLQSDAGPPPTRQERRNQVAALRQTAEAELAKILDHSQFTAYTELDESDKLGAARNARPVQRGQ